MQGFNMGRYVPPDKEGLTTGNALHRKRTTPATVRFEMPFAVWCSHCPKPTIIGQGVRFNATKTRVGAYHSTAIWAFRFKHAACGGELEIRTDPKNTAYVVTEGGKKRDTGDEKSGPEEFEGGRRILTDAEREELRKSAFKRLERTIEDREAAKQGNERIEGLMDQAHRDWSDPYERNQRLRRTFREGRKEREREAKGVEALRVRLGLGGEDEDEGGLKILPPTREDELRAGMVEFQPLVEDGGAKALAKPLFSGGEASKRKATGKTKGTTKAEVRAAQRKEELVSRIAGNTRAATDPFLNAGTAMKNGVTPGKLLPGVKRKRSQATHQDGGDEGGEQDGEELPPPAKAVAGLVDYDSD
ncbi:hypothetical protein NLU13_7691 [Sarocladium strictum]|uniref:Uncharacterized protein n=1 Tax=Sarocladium strictum TaxID=5046 RepID=A0AA39GDZ3_SARSR|nr:hypothetical protein NLU13_7691 [Sarocladium strictum]